MNGLKGFRQWHAHWTLLDIFRALGLLASSWAFVLLWASAYQAYWVQPFVSFLSYHVERDFHGQGKQFLPETFLIQIELARGQKCAGGSLLVNFNFQAAPFIICSHSFCFSHHRDSRGCEEALGAEGNVHRFSLQPQAFTRVMGRGSLLCLEAGSNVAH